MNKNIVYGSIISGGNVTIGDSHNSNTNNMNQIQALVAQNRIDEALALFGNSSDVVLLTSRWNSLKRQKMLGTISSSDEGVERSRIITALLSYVGADSSFIPTLSATPTHTQPKSWEQILLDVEAKYTRQNPAIANEASQLLVLFRQYYDRKRVSKIFDINGTRLKEHEAELDKFLGKVNGQVMESRENFVEKVAELLSATVPDWSSIEEAFTLCVGRGMSSNHMENVIQKRPNDDEAKLRIVEAIESFLSAWV